VYAPERIPLLTERHSNEQHGKERDLTPKEESPGSAGHYGSCNTRANSDGKPAGYEYALSNTFEREECQHKREVI
jgi:hypothetical protein